jgi:Flp pilus assembly protein TadG
MPVLLALLVGIFEFGIAWNRKQVLTNAAREGARLGVLKSAGTTDVENTIDQYLADAGIAPGDVNRTYSGIGSTARTGDTVTVALSMNHELAFVGPILGLMGGSFPGAVTLSTTVNMRHE